MVVSFPPFVLDGERRQLFEHGVEVHLSPKAYLLLTALVEQRPRAVSKAELMARLWPNTFVQEANLGVLVGEVRAALRDEGRQGRFIRTVHGYGYAFAADAVNGQRQSARPAEPPPGAQPDPVRPSRLRRAGWTAAFLLLIAVAASLTWRWTGGMQPRPAASMRLTIDLPRDRPLAPAGLVSPAHDRPALALSPDGSQLAYVAVVAGRTQICLRDMASGTVRPLAHTDGGHTPFFSPDGGWLGFFADHKLKKISVKEGPPTVLADAPSPWGATWGPGDTIYFNRREGEGIVVVGASGGQVELVSEGNQTMPALLGRSGLMTFGGSGSGLRYTHLGGAPGSRYVAEGACARYVGSGHLVYGSGDRLMAAPFDRGRLATTGPSVTLAEGLRTAPYGVAQFTLSDEGTLVYVAGGPQDAGLLVWVDREGKTSPFGLPEGNYAGFALSPDDSRLAFGRDGDIWAYDTRLGTTTRVSPRVTKGKPTRNAYPCWTPDGRRIIYLSRQVDRPARLVEARSDGGGEPIELWRSGELGPTYLYPTAFAPDGRLSVFGPSRDGGLDMFLMSVPGPGGAPSAASRPALFLGTPYGESFGRISPDGRRMLFSSDMSGDVEVYVTSYPTPGPITQISRNGGREPMWNPAAPEIVYADGLSMYAVDILPGEAFRVGEPRVLFTGEYPDAPGAGYDVSHDGRRFLMIENKDVLEPTTVLNVITNISEELRRRVPPSSK